MPSVFLPATKIKKETENARRETTKRTYWEGTEMPDAKTAKDAIVKGVPLIRLDLLGFPWV